VADYRIYLIDKNNRIVAPPEVLTSDTDDAVIIQAKQIANGHGIEVWEGQRFVAGLKSRGARS
jgi:hypothetical protein